MPRVFMGRVFNVRAEVSAAALVRAPAVLEVHVVRVPVGGRTGMIDVPDSITYAMHGHATRMRRRFPMVEHDDLVQEQWLWLLSHPRIVKRYLEDTENGGVRKLSRALRNAALAYCHKEKARAVGYETDDVYFYSVGLLRELLPAVWDDDAWSRVGRSEVSDAPVGKSAPAEGNNIIACLVDVKRAVERLPAQPRSVLLMQFKDGMDDVAIAAVLDTTVEAVGERVGRALRRLQQELGGDRPDWVQAKGPDDVE